MSQGTSLSQAGDGSINPAQATCSYVNSPALDSGFSRFLDLYRQNGTAINYGVLLIQKLPRSRPRDAGPLRIVFNHSWPVTTTASIPVIEGLYVLKKLDVQDAGTDWPEKMEATLQTPAAETGALPWFIGNLKGGYSLGAQVENIAGSYGGGSIRHKLAIKLFPTTTGSAILRAVSPVGIRDLLNGGYITISTHGSATAVQKSVANLTTLFYHHRGYPRLWIVVQPTESRKFENHIRAVFPDVLAETGESGLCSQFLKHLSLWITPDLLRSWGVGFTQIWLEAENMMAVFPSAYYWGMATGFSIIEMKTVMSSQWELNGYRFCATTRPLCSIAQPNSAMFTITQRAIDDAVAEEAAKKAKSTAKRISKPRTAKKGGEMNSKTMPSTSEASGYDGDESFQPTYSSGFMRADPSPNPQTLIPGQGNNYMSHQQPANPYGRDTALEQHNDAESSLYPNTVTSEQYQRLLDEVVALREQNREFFAAHVQSVEREAALAREMAHHRAYSESLEAELANKVPGFMHWKEAALKGYRVVGERNKRIEELEEELRNKAGGGGGGGNGGRGDNEMAG